MAVVVNNKLYNVQEAAKYLGLAGRSSVIAAVGNGRLRRRDDGFFDQASLDFYDMNKRSGRSVFPTKPTYLDQALKQAPTTIEDRIAFLKRVGELRRQGVSREEALKQAEETINGG